MRSAINLGLGLLIAAAVPGLHAQVANPMTTTSGVKSALGNQGQTAQQPAKPSAKPATPAPAKPAPAKPPAQGQAKPGPVAAKPEAQASKPTAGSQGKAETKTAKRVRKARVAKAPAKAVEKPATPGAAPSAAESEVKAARRDPFESLVNRSQGKGAPNLPPGKAGLQVSTLRLDGIVRAPNGMIAVVSNPQSRVYFLREGDHLYDGSVEKITMDGVSFHEEGKDAFGKPVERQVNKRIYSTSSGEQQ
jgi:Tfp pilus assembly protein PilP